MMNPFKQAAEIKKLRDQAKKIQDELSQIEVESEKGRVKVVMTGDMKVKSVEINGERFDVTFKVAYVNGEIISNRPEYEDLLKIANKTNIPLIEVKKIISDYND